MGYFKELEIERMENPFIDVPQRLVGISSFDNRLLRDYFDKYGEIGVCSYTGKEELTLPLCDVVRLIYDTVMEHFEDACDEAGWVPDMEDDGKVPGFHIEGNGYVIPDSRTYYDNIDELLEDEGLRVNNAAIYNDVVCYMPDCYNLVERDLYGLNESEELAIDWREIVRKAPTWMQSADYGSNMSDVDKTRLYNLITQLQTVRRPMIKEMELDVYRTVRYAEEQPDIAFSKLTSPPVQYTTDLRMSPKGVSMFYGACNSELTLDEAVGSDKKYAYTGRFTTLHPVVLLDLRHIHQMITIFDVSSEEYQRLLFLRYFADEISKPVANDNQTAEYAPTQFITALFRKSLKYYKKDKTRVPIDGILYDSSKANGWNVVLFYDNTESSEHLRLESHQLHVTK